MTAQPAAPFYKQTWFFVVVGIVLLMLLAFGTLIVFVITSAVSAAQRHAHLQNPLLVVHSADKIELLDQATTLPDLHVAALRLKDELAASGTNPSNVAIRIQVVGDITCGEFSEIVSALNRARFFETHVRVSDQHELTLDFGKLLAMRRDENLLPPIVVQLSADQAGDLSSMKMGERSIVGGTTVLRAEIDSLVGGVDPNQPIHDSFVLEFRPDKELRFRHLLNVWDQSTSYVKDGQRHWLVGNVVIVSPADDAKDLEAEIESFEDLRP